MGLQAAHTAPTLARSVAVGREALPMAHVVWQFWTGALGDDPARPGVAAMSSDLALMGPRSLERDAFFRALERYGSDVSVATGHRTTVVTLAALTERLAETVALVEEALTDPALRESDFDLLRREAVAAWFSTLEDDSELGHLHGLRALFGPAGYGRLVSSTAASLAAMTMDDLRVSARRLVAAPLRMGVSGDWGTLDPAQLSRLSNPAPSLPDPHNPGLPVAFRPPHHRHVALKGHGSTRIALLAPTQLPTEPGYSALHIANEAFGGLFTSRLIRALRVEAGVSYEGGSTLFRNLGATVLQLNACPDGADLPKALTAMRDAMARYAEEGPTPQEFERARQHALRRLPLLRITADRELATRLGHALIGLPDDTHERWAAELSALTHAEVVTASRAYDPSRFTLCTVGALKGKKAVAAAWPGLALDTVLPADLQD
jgi:zinc protease